jgi:hypothetical protein
MRACPTPGASVCPRPHPNEANRRRHCARGGAFDAPVSRPDPGGGVRGRPVSGGHGKSVDSGRQLSRPPRSPLNRSPHPRCTGPYAGMATLTRGSVEAFGKANYLLGAASAGDLIRRHVSLATLELGNSVKHSEFAHHDGTQVDGKTHLQGVKDLVVQLGLGEPDRIGVTTLASDLLSESSPGAPGRARSTHSSQAWLEKPSTRQATATGIPSAASSRTSGNFILGAVPGRRRPLPGAGSRSPAPAAGSASWRP